MANISNNNFSALLGNRMPASNAPATAPTPAAVMPPRPGDSMAFNAAPNVMANAPMVTAPPDMRNDLLDLRKQLMDMNRELEQMLTQMNATQQPPTQLAPGIMTAQTANPATQLSPGQVKVQAGDYLWKIAKEQLGDARRWPEIYRLNQNVIGDNPGLLQPGQVLQMPGGASQAAALAPQQSFAPQQGLPPQQQPLPNAAPDAFAQAMAQLGQLGQTTATQGLPANPQAGAGSLDVAAVPGTPDLVKEADLASAGREFGLLPPSGQITPDVRANIQAFASEIRSYDTTYRGQVFGPDTDNTNPALGPVVSPQEAQQVHASITEIKKVLQLLITTGKLQVTLPTGQPVQQLNQSGSFFLLDAQGAPQKDAQGNPLMDQAFVAAVTRFKADHGIHQTYRTGDGTYAINEYIGPATIAALEQAVSQIPHA